MTTPTGESTHDHEACVKLLTDTLARLDEISESHMQGILDIAIAAADAANSIAPGSRDADEFIEKVTALVESFKTKAETAQGGGDMGGGGGAPEQSAGVTSDKFCEMIERDINIAIENALTLQQQLNVSGIAVLNEGASLILNAGSSGSK
jgi:hypothetical protein